MMANGVEQVEPKEEHPPEESAESVDTMVPWDADYPPMVPGYTPSTSSKRMARRWTFTLSSALGTDPNKAGSTLEDLDESNEADCLQESSPTPTTSPTSRGIPRRVTFPEPQGENQPGHENTAVDTKRCPCCNRTFAPRSYDRHVLLCTTKSTSEPAPLKVSKQEAKERLEARIKYRPEKRALKRTVKEKYQKVTKETKEKPSVSPISAKSTPLPTRRTVTTPSKSTKTSPKLNKVALSPNINTKTKASNNKSNNTNTSKNSEYNPFIIAERQLMELLECTEQTPSKNAIKKPTQVKPKSPLPNKSLISPTLKQRNQQIESNQVVSKDDMDFEALENFINDNYDNDEMMHKLDLDTISLGGCSTKTENTSYFDDVSIDPRLINDFDNLSIPEHFDTQATTTPEMASQYIFTNCIRLDPLGHSEHFDNIDVRNMVYKKPAAVEEKSNKLPSPQKNEASPKLDPKVYEEFSFFDKNYIIKRDVHNEVVGPGDSAYGSLNRTPKVRSRVAPLTSLGTSMLKEEESANSDEDSAMWAKFCHQCGKTYPIKMARFCVWCGTQRLRLE